MTQHSSAKNGKASAFEREKWEDEVHLREREIALKKREQATKERELETKIEEQQRSRWTNPLVVATLAGAVAAGGSAVVALINGYYQRSAEDQRAGAERQLQTVKSDAELKLDTGKAEAARIL